MVKPYEVFDLSLTNSSLMGWLAKVNSFTDVGEGGILGFFILLVIGVPLFLMMKSYGNERALAVSGFITTLIGLFLRIFGLINDTTFYICIIVLVGSLILLFKEAAQYES